MYQEQTTQSIRMYMLQPGDGTRYRFGIANLDGTGEVISGIGNGNDYFLLVILSEYGSGNAVLGRWMVKDVQHHDIGYAQGHGMRNVNEYTLTACLLAAGVLLDNPSDLDGACAAMLRTPEVLA
jgi:hypothetical protein